MSTVLSKSKFIVVIKFYFAFLVIYDYELFFLYIWTSVLKFHIFFFFDKKYCIFGKFGTAERLAYLMNEKK